MMTMTLFLLISLATPVATMTGPALSLKDTAWLAGCWTGGTGGRQVDEQWMAPGGGAMLGMSRTVAKGRTVASEFIQLREEGPDVFYIAKPADQPEARFKLVAADASQLRFENPNHDFPQVITYKLESGGKLLAQIQGKSNGKPLTIDFPMQRTDCR